MQGVIVLTISELMKNKHLSKYRLSKNSGVPYTTVNDICSGRARLEKCSAETIYRLSQELGVSMESLLEPYLHPRISFELFKSNACHRLKQLGDLDFILDTLQHNDIRSYYERGWHSESLYLLAMLDYISRINGVPLCADYDDLRRCSLQEPVYPASILSIAAATKSQKAKDDARAAAIPEFLRFNIVENEVRDVV